jgi:hypothetical protein
MTMRFLPLSFCSSPHCPALARSQTHLRRNDACGGTQLTIGFHPN